jgi:hypothetical protein
MIKILIKNLIKKNMKDLVQKKMISHYNKIKSKLTTKKKMRIRNYSMMIPLFKINLSIMMKMIKKIVYYVRTIIIIKLKNLKIRKFKQKK